MKTRRHKGFSGVISRWPWQSLAISLTAGIAVGWWLIPSTQENRQQGHKSVTSPPPASDAKLIQAYQDDIRPMLETYCYECHMDGSDKGGLDLDAYPDLASMRKDPKIWEHILARIDYHLMPPPKEEQPAKEEREKIIAWINDAIFPVDPNNPDPGHVVIRRLNQIEYQNTIRDLLGVTIDASKILPPDDSGYGFDNIGSVLTISPAHVEKYLHAAELALDKALVIGPPAPASTTFDPNAFNGGGTRNTEGIYFSQNGKATVSTQVKRSGNYQIHVTASAQQAGKHDAKLDIYLNDKKIQTHLVTNPLGTEKQFTTSVKLTPGQHKISVAFPNDYYDPKHKDPSQRDRNLMVHQVQLKSLGYTNSKKPETHTRIFTPRAPGVSDSDYARTVLKQFIRRAFRRPTSNSEIDRYVSLIQQITDGKQSLETGIYTALQAILVSPSFLYIAPPQTPQANPATLITEHALASRLSYFLWSTMPDDRLLQLADEGKLRKQIEQEVVRMLEDSRSKEMIRHFTGQWLQLRDLDAVTPSRKKFPSFSNDLARDMRTETEMLTDHILRDNHSLLDFLNADYSFVNHRLAHHYAMIGVKGSEFRKVRLAGTHRRGFLTHASLLTLTSQPTRTSPVLRGKFVLENILDIEPPPPPPNLPQLDDPEKHGENMTLRDQLALHRKKTACAGCHNLMDPVGLAFEHFDAIGRFRESSNGKPIDASGKLVTGEKLENAESLRQVIANQKSDEFIRCLTSKLLTYALGRGVTRTDRITINNILRDLKKNDYHSRSLILGIINSVPFQQRGNTNSSF